MALGVEELKLLITGNATSGIAALREAGAASEALGAEQGAASAETKALGLNSNITGGQLKAGLAAGAAAAGLALAKFALDGAQAFVDTTAQVRGLRNVMGGTAEDASRVAGATRLLGMDVDTVGKGFFQLTKRIADNKDTLAQHGIEVQRNNDGSVNMAQTLGVVSDKFKGMTDPAERNLFLMQNFGKAGATMIPLLSQGSEKLKEFYAQTAAHHEIFSEDDLQKGREYKLAMNSLDDAWKGLSMELGREVVPLLAQFARGLTTIIEVAPQAVSAVMKFTGIGPALSAVGDVVGTIGDALGLTGEKVKPVGVELHDLQARFAGLDATSAAKQFAAINTEAMKSPEHVGKANQALLDFVQIAQTDVGSAQQVIDGLKALGINTDVYQRALTNIAGKKYADLQATQQQKDANVLLTGSYTDQLGIMNKLADAELAKADKDFAAQRATWAAKDAVDALNTANQAAADAGGQDAAANEAAAKALIDAEDAALKAAGAARDKAQADHEGEGSAAAHAAATYAQVSSLQNEANTLDPGSPLRVFLEQYIAKLSDPAINGIHTAGVAVTYPDLGPLGDLLTMLNNIKAIGDINTRVTVTRDEIVAGQVGSDRDSKHDIAPLAAGMILERLEQLEVSTWRYNDEPGNPLHLGPMAQDFAAMFMLGADTRTIATVDYLGVLLAGLQELARRVHELEGAAHA